MKTAIIGYGKMGREIENILIERGHSVVLKIDVDNAADLNAANLKDVDVAIEFTSPATAYNNVRTCIECGTAVVCGSTGWIDRIGEINDLCKAKNGAFFYSSNYSIGVNVMFKLNKMLAMIMKSMPEYSVKIEETHHIHKKDAPSGTAVTLAKQIYECSGRKIEKSDIVSYREGEVPGIHTVTYDSEDDTITLKHSAKSRRGLAVGAVMAAEFLHGKHGLFSMEDMLKL